MKPANLTQYESLQWDLARARGLQRVLKIRRKQIGAEIAFCNTRFRDNGGHFEGRDMVPLRAAQDMISAVRKQAAIERDIVKTRLSIRRMEARLACMKIAHAFSRTLEQVLRSIQPPTARQCLGQILRFQGLHLGLWKVGLYKPVYTTCPTCKWQQLGPGPCRVIPLHDTWMREVNENRERFRAELKAKAEARRRAKCAVSR